MTYELAFVVSALKEWKKLAAPIREQFKDKLRQRLANPHVACARLHNLPDCYKIKLRAAGYRLVYQVDDKIVLVTVIAVRKRDKGLAYTTSKRRLK